MRSAHVLHLLVAVTGISGIASASMLFSDTDVATLNSSEVTISTLCENFSSTTAASTPCSSTYAFAGSTDTYTATGAANYGVLKVSGSNSISHSGPAGSGGPNYIESGGDAEFEDTWTIGGAPSGTTGTLMLVFSIDASSSDSGIDTGFEYGLDLTNDTVFQQTSANPPPCLVTTGCVTSYTGTLSTTFTFGTPFEFSVNLGAGSLLPDVTDGGYNGQASSIDLADTATLTSIVVQNQSGTTLSTFTLQTQSGAALFNSLVPAVSGIPEPASLVLAGFGLLALSLSARFRARAGNRRGRSCR